MQYMDEVYLDLHKWPAYTQAFIFLIDPDIFSDVVGSTQTFL